MPIRETHYIVFYGAKNGPEDTLHRTGPIFSESGAEERGTELKKVHGYAYFNKYSRKGKLLQSTVITLGVTAPANA